MMGTRNPNHRNSFSTLEKKVIDETIVEDKEDIILDDDNVRKEYIYSLNKKQQKELLTDIGYTNAEIKKLKHEEDRVNEILKPIGVD